MKRASERTSDRRRRRGADILARVSVETTSEPRVSPRSICFSEKMPMPTPPMRPVMAAMPAERRAAVGTGGRRRKKYPPRRGRAALEQGLVGNHCLRADAAVGPAPRDGTAARASIIRQDAARRTTTVDASRRRRLGSCARAPAVNATDDSIRQAHARRSCTARMLMPSTESIKRKIMLFHTI